MTTAFVLTGGGSLGAAQVGALLALEDHGIRPDLLVGTSVGAINAVFLAGPGDHAERLHVLAALWSALHRRDVFVADPRRWLGALRSAPSLFDAAPLRRLLETHLGYDDLADARVPTHVVATDLTAGTVQVLSTGDVVGAVLASAAVPGLLPPVTRDGRLLVDGGFGPHVGLGHADRLGADDIYLVPAGYQCAPRRAPTTALGISLTALALLIHVQLLTEVEEYAGHARLHVLPPSCPQTVSPADFRHADELMRRARAASAASLARPSADLSPAARIGLHDHTAHAHPRTARAHPDGDLGATG